MTDPIVDVLAVLDDLFEDFTIAGNYCGEGCWFNDGEEVRAKARYADAIAAVAELIEAGKRTDAAIMAWRMSGKPGLGELNAAHGDLIAALARVGGA